MLFKKYIYIFVKTKFISAFILGYSNKNLGSNGLIGPNGYVGSKDRKAHDLVYEYNPGKPINPYFVVFLQSDFC